MAACLVAPNGSPSVLGIGFTLTITPACRLPSSVFWNRLL